MDKSLIDLFAGCGGLSLGLTQAGFQIEYGSDIDAISLNTYQKNHNIPNDSLYQGDISELNRKIKQSKIIFSNIDLVCGGPPCQGFSMANRQRIIDDPRNILYKEYLRFLSMVRPRFFIMENVKGMLNKITEILNDFNHILNGEYNVSYGIFNAKNYGVPQNRERVIIIGNRIDIQSSDIVEDINAMSDNMPHFIISDALEGLPELKPNHNKHNTSLENMEIGFFERDFDYKHTPFYKFINNGRTVSKLYNHKNRYNNDRDIEIYSRLPQGANSLHESIRDIMPYSSRNNIFKDKYFKLDPNCVCKTITSHMKYDCNMYIHPYQPRGLSPREAARIQTFPDDYIFYGPQNSWYKQIGNAVPVKMAECIGKAVMNYI